MQKLNNRAILEEQKSKIKTQLLDKQAYLAALKLRREQQDITEEIAIQNVMKQTGASREVAAAQVKAAAQLEEAALDAEIQKTQQEITGLKLKDAETTVQLAQNAGGIVSIFGNLLSILTPIIGLMQIINMLQLAYNKSAEKGTQIEKKNFLQKLKSIPVMISKAYLACVDQLGPVAGTIAFAAIAAVIAGLGIAAGVGIAKGIQGTSKSGSQKTADDINKLSNEIYKLENKARALDTVTKSYNDLDNQIIKTQKDQEKMNELLDQAADKLDEEEQKAYKSLATNEQRIRYLEATQSKAEQDANQKRQEQLNKINKLSPNQRADFLDPNSTDSDVLTAQSAIYAINNAKLYDFVDRLEDAQEGVEKLAQSLLSQLSPAEALAFANAPDKIEALVKKLNNTAVQVGDTAVGVTGILTSDDYSVVDKVNAYREALEALDGSMKDAFEILYSDIGALATFNNVVLEFIDNNGISIDSINAIGKAIQKLGYDSDEATYKLEELFNNIAQSDDIRESIYNTFGDISDEDYKKFINAYQSAMGTGVLNMGQNIEGLKKTINSFYEKAQQWNEMSDSEKTSFLADNAELFEGPDGQKLLEAIKSGDYNFIQNALGDNETLKAKVAQQIKDIDTEIAIENAKLEADRDYAYIAYLEEQKKLLQDSNNLYAASLDVRLEQEKKYLDEYKSYLEDQRDALKESLDKRKEAYSDYFEAINRQADDEDFEEKESTLIANISKLATSGSADAVNQQAKLEQELAQLEKERLEELRQRAQDSVMENIDKTIENIDQKFDELLNSQQALLAAMTGELDNPTEFLSNLISNKVQQEGLTELGLESYIRDLQSTYGSVLGNGVFDNMSVEKQGDQLVLNIAGTEVVLSDSDQQSIYTAIMTALQQVGLR